MASTRGTSHRFGVVVPPENPTVEAELARLRSPSHRAVVSRLPVTSGSLADRLEAYNSSLATMARSFGGMDLASIYLACTGSSYLVGPSGDRELAANLGSAGARPLTAARAIVDTLAALGRSRIFVVSPYPDWLTDQAVAYWRASGLSVEGTCSVPAPRGIYGITADEVVRLLANIDPGDADAVLLSGTGMPTIEPIERIGTSLSIPVISSSLAAIYQLDEWSSCDESMSRVLIDRWR